MEPGETSGLLCWYEEGSSELHKRWPTLLDFLVAQTKTERRIRAEYDL